MSIVIQGMPASKARQLRSDVFDSDFRRYLTPIIVRLIWRLVIVLALVCFGVIGFLAVFPWLNIANEMRVAGFDLSDRVIASRSAWSLFMLFNAFCLTLVVMGIRMLLEVTIVIFDLARQLGSINRIAKQVRVKTKK